MRTRYETHSGDCRDFPVRLYLLTRETRSEKLKAAEKIFA